MLIFAHNVFLKSSTLNHSISSQNIQPCDRTHSVPEFANKLISAQRQGSHGDQHVHPGHSPMETDVRDSPDTGNADVFTNHKPFSSDDELFLTTNNGIKEVLMVLNATGKVNPKNRTRLEGSRLEDTDPLLSGYYPKNYDVESDYYDVIEEIDDDIEDISRPGQKHTDYWSRDGPEEPRDKDQMSSSELDNDLNTRPDADQKTEEKKYYPVRGDTTIGENDDANSEILIDPQNISDNILNSWDTHSDELLSNDQFITELEREKLAKSRLKELLGTESDDGAVSENYPLKSLMSDTSVENEEQPDSASINPEKLAYILIGVRGPIIVGQLAIGHWSCGMELSTCVIILLM